MLLDPKQLRSNFTGSVLDLARFPTACAYTSHGFDPSTTRLQYHYSNLNGSYKSFRSFRLTAYKSVFSTSHGVEPTTSHTRPRSARAEWDERYYRVLFSPTGRKYEHNRNFRLCYKSKLSDSYLKTLHKPFVSHKMLKKSRKSHF